MKIISAGLLFRVLVSRSCFSGMRAFALVSLLAFTSVQAQSSAGIIEGTVLGVSNGAYLNNARVTVDGSRLETFTDANGTFRLANVPAGAALVRVSYTGLETQTAKVTVAPAATARQDFELSLPLNQTTQDNKSVVKLENFVVETTALTAAAAAINEQKFSPNIKNIVVLEEIGDLGDGNVGEYLKYTPGVSIVSGPQTAASMSIRGLPSSGVVFMVDGAEVSSPSADRSFDLAASSSGSVDRVEITKVPTPDRPANAVGGTVNIIGKSGFSSPRRSLKINTYGAYNSNNRLSPPGLSDKVGSDSHSNARSIQPGIDISYAQPVNKSFAFTLNLSELTRVYDMDYDSPTWDMIKGIQTTNLEQNVLQTTERQLAAASIDWKLNRENSFRLNVEHVQINTPTRQNVFTTVWGAGATGNADYTQGASAGNDIIRQTMTYGDRTRGTSSAVLHYVHDGKLYKIDANANFSRSWDKRDDINHGFFRTIGNFQVGSLIVRADGLSGIYDRRAPKLTATTRTGAAFDPYDNAQLAPLNPTSQPNEITSDMKSAAANISRELNLVVPMTLKVGFSVNKQRKDNTSALTTWTFAPPATASRLVKDYDLTNDSLSAQSFFNDTLKVKWVSPSKYFNLFKAHPDWFTTSETATYQSGVTNSKYFEETISAAYIRDDIKLLDNKLWLVGGVRFERTDDFGQGPLDDLRATFKQDASGNLLKDAAGKNIPVTTDALATAKLRYTERGAEAKRNYSGYYPSVNATYYFNESLVARAAFAQTIGRPNLTSIIPGISVTDPAVANPTATIVNSGLKPWTADNYDLSVETYSLKGATVALSLFRKDISGFFSSTQIPATSALLQSYGLGDEYLNYTIITQANGGDASIEGYEASWRQSLYFLPSWAKGFSTYVNATIAHVSGNDAAAFTPFAHKNINWGASYARRGFTFRWNVAYAYKVTGALVAASATIPAGTASYVAPQITQDWSFQYKFSKRFSFYGSARNWNGANKRTERAGPGTPAWTRPQSYQNFGTLVTLGVRTEF